MPKGMPAIQPAQRDDYETPPPLFDALWEEVGGFDMDVACTPGQYTARRVLKHGGQICIPPDHPMSDDECERLIGAPGRILRDGLAQPWHGKVWLQPPYGLALRKWVPMAVREAEGRYVELVMALLPVRTDTIWWQEYVVTRLDITCGKSWDNANVDHHPALYEVRFLPGRLKFVGAPDPATFPSAIVVWRR